MSKGDGLFIGGTKKGVGFYCQRPRGDRKDHACKKLLDEFPSVVASISYTTREPREGEIPGIHYHFITKPEFEEKIAAGDFLEYVTLYGTYYGTCWQWIKERQDKGKHIILVIDTQGALKLKETFPAILVFIRPPSLDILRERLTTRQTETAGMIDQRLEWARRELEAAQYYDYQIVNDDLETAYQILRSILIAECHKT